MPFCFSSRFSLLVYVLPLLHMLNSCLSAPHYNKASLTLAWNEKAKRMLILGKDLELHTRLQGRGALPYSDNDHTAVWVGVDFPFQKAVKLIGWSRNYYRELRYFALSDLVSPFTKRYDKDLFIGGATSKALELGLRAWTQRDFAKLGRVKTKAQFHRLIRSRYPKQAKP